MRKYIYECMKEYCQSLYEGDSLKEGVASGKIDFNALSPDPEESKKTYWIGKHYYNLKYTWKYCFDYFAAASVVYMDELKSRGRFREKWDVASIGCGTGFDYWALGMARYILSDPRKEQYKDSQCLRGSRIHYRGYDVRPVERFLEEDEIGDHYEYSEGGIEAWYESEEVNDLIFFGRSVEEVFGAQREDLENQPEVKKNIDRFVKKLAEKICREKKEDPVYLVMAYIMSPDPEMNGGLVIDMQCGSYLISRLEQDCKIKTEMVRLPLDHVGYLEEKTLNPNNYNGVEKYIGVVETDEKKLYSNKPSALLSEKRVNDFPDIWQFRLIGAGYPYRSKIEEALRDVSGDQDEHMLISDKFSAYHIIKISIKQ